mgnify:CR=1 FL=1
MEIKEAHEMVKNYVLEEFDDRWSTEHILFTQHPDFLEFFINSKKYFQTRRFEDQFVGLGQGFISKKHKEIVQYGSGHGLEATRDFLKTEYKLNTIRTQYQIGRTSYDHHVIIRNIKDIQKAFKYFTGIKIYCYNIPSLKEIQHERQFEFSSMNYFGLLNLLYFNVIDPFCHISFEKRIASHHQRYFSWNNFDSEDELFQNHILDKILMLYPTFDIHQNYRVIITDIIDTDRLNQYLKVSYFRHHGLCELTGYIGHIQYTNDELQAIILGELRTFDFIYGKDLFFFLWMNMAMPSCKIEMEVLSND